MAINYSVYLGQNSMIDALGSVTINVNSVGSPSYQWVNVSNVFGYGAPGSAMGLSIPHRDTVSYKIKNLEFLSEANDPGQFVGDTVCLTDPNNCTGRGPFLINGSKYFIDYMFLYIVNTGDEPVYSPVFSIIGDLPVVNGAEFCNPEYGYFIGVPQVPVNTNVTTADPSSILAENPLYTNDLGAFGATVSYRFTSVNASQDFITSTITPSNIITAATSAIEYGQLAIVTLDDQNTAPELLPGEHYPFVLFRYVSENATTRPIDISFRYGINVGNGEPGDPGDPGGSLTITSVLANIVNDLGSPYDVPDDFPLEIDPGSGEGLESLDFVFSDNISIVGLPEAVALTNGSDGDGNSNNTQVSSVSVINGNTIRLLIETDWGGGTDPVGYPGAYSVTIPSALVEGPSSETLATDYTTTFTITAPALPF